MATNTSITIPPIIEGWIKNLTNETLPFNTRENYRDNLEQVAVAINKAVSQFNTSGFKPRKIGK